jgi:hypothetical protein
VAEQRVIRVTDATLDLARRNPLRMAAWVLRSIIDEAIEGRQGGTLAKTPDSDTRHLDSEVYDLRRGRRERTTWPESATS